MGPKSDVTSSVEKKKILAAAAQELLKHTSLKLCKKYCIALKQKQTGSHAELCEKLVFRIGELMEADESPIAKLEKFSSEIIKGKSSITTEYGKLFSGVDKFDALLSHIGKQPRKEGLCKILVFHLIRITIVNSFVIYENIASKSSQMVPRDFADAVYKFLLRL